MEGRFLISLKNWGRKSSITKKWEAFSKGDSKVNKQDILNTLQT